MARIGRRRTEKDPESSGKVRGDTRQNLIDSAMVIVTEDTGGLAGMSLREVTRRAGVSPTAFYRHFTDMEELGLALLDEVGVVLRGMLRAVRKQAATKDMISNSVRVLVEYGMGQRGALLVLTRERAGGSLRMRSAIRSQMSHFATELASDLRLMNLFPQMTQADLQRLAGIIISLAVSATPDILDLPEDNQAAVDEFVKDLEKQVLIVLLGAQSWRAKTPDEKKRRKK